MKGENSSIADKPVSFFDAQASHRLAARLWGMASALLVLCLGGFFGFLLMVVISFYGLLILGLLPKWLTQPLAAVGVTDNLPPAWFLLTSGILLAAGLALLVRSLLGAAPLGAIESAVGLRPVNSSDLEERQLANIVGEMAIAGSVPEPRVFLMEGEIINAGAAGYAPSMVFVSRRLLDHLDRDETQGVLGHLLASIANGDFRIASGVLTVLQTLGLFMTLMDAPFSSRAREVLGTLVRYLIQRPENETSIAAHRAASQLTLSLQPEGMNDLLAFMERTLNLPLPLGPFNKVVGSLALILLMPLILSRLAGFITYSLLILFVLGPLPLRSVRVGVSPMPRRCN